ncbi:MAG TPA: hypothetical protein VG452_13615 [Egibacteraceae bacterium]|nr:hypothetical protein [Egibacteraceae bacterium]
MLHAGRRRPGRVARRSGPSLALLLALMLAFCSPPGEQPGQPPGDGGAPPRPPPAPQTPREATSPGFVVVGHADPGGGLHADVVALGRHAYLASAGSGELVDGARPYCRSAGVRVYDLNDPANPALVSTFADAASDPRVAGSRTEKLLVRAVSTAAFRGDLAAVGFQSCAGDEGFRGFGLYDVTDPTSPRTLALVATDRRANGAHELWLDPRDDAAYVYTAVPLSELRTSPDGRSPGDQPDFMVFDVSDPASPRRVGQWGAWAQLGVAPQATDPQGVLREHLAHSVIAEGTTAYLSYWDLGTVILDLNDPANPLYVGRTTFAPHQEGNAHSAWLAAGGRILVETDEDVEPTPVGPLERGWGHPRVFDLSDPAHPSLLAEVELASTRQLPPPGPGHYSVHDPKVAG